MWVVVRVHDLQENVVGEKPTGKGERIFSSGYLRIIQSVFQPVYIRDPASLSNKNCFFPKTEPKKMKLHEKVTL